VTRSTPARLTDRQSVKLAGLLASPAVSAVISVSAAVTIDRPVNAMSFKLSHRHHRLVLRHRAVIFRPGNGSPMATNVVVVVVGVIVITFPFLDRSSSNFAHILMTILPATKLLIYATAFR